MLWLAGLPELLPELWKVHYWKVETLQQPVSDTEEKDHYGHLILVLHSKMVINQLTCVGTCGAVGVVS